MKHAKRFASLLLALVMVMGLATTAFAANSTGSITISNAENGQTYTIYRILELEGYDKTAGAYAYKATSAWENFITGNDIKGTYVNVDTQGYVTWVQGASAADFAKLAQKYAADNSLSNQGSATATSATVSFNNLELGYYLVDSSLGTLCSLDTTEPDVTIQEKNKVPTNEKKVEEDSTNAYGEKNDADIGQTVNFQSTITLPRGSENIVFHDTMSTGLTLDTGSIKVYTDAAMTTELTNANNTNYTVKTSGLTDGCTFEISFTKTYLDGLTADSTVYVKYAATVNENAVVGGNGNTNTSKVSYGDTNNTKTTPDSTTTTYIWDLDVFKYAQDGQTEKPLSGATFTLSKNSDGTNPIALVRKKDAQGADTNTYRVAKPGETGTVTEITTDATGKFTIEGLDADTYYLTEKTAPAGYNKLADPITVVIDSDGNTKVNNSEVNEVKVLNQTGSELPTTGGMGTTIFYVVGGILVAGAAVLLIVKKRMSAEKGR